jgi:hypothetical protein
LKRTIGVKEQAKTKNKKNNKIGFKNVKIIKPQINIIYIYIYQFKKGKHTHTHTHTHTKGRERTKNGKKRKKILN